MRVNLKIKQGKKHLSLKYKYLVLKNGINKLDENNKRKILGTLDACFAFANALREIHKKPEPKFPLGGYINKHI